MTAILWWIGALHVAAYTLAGAVQLTAYLVWWCHKRTNYVRRIMEWHIAKARWDRRSVDGLTDSEWKQGEPRP